MRCVDMFQKLVRGCGYKSVVSLVTHLCDTRHQQQEQEDQII